MITITRLNIICVAYGSCSHAVCDIFILVLHQTGADLYVHIFSASPNVHLDTPLRYIFGEDFMVWDGYRRLHINTRDLLAHRPGIPTDEMHWMLGAILDRDEIL